MTNKLSISVTDELRYALESLSITYHMDRSRVIETLLREHPIVKKEVDILRSEPKHGALTASPRVVAKTRKAKAAAPVASS